MPTMTTTLKKRLGDLLVIGYARLGRVSPRKPYREDDDGGEGAADLLFETHPLLAEQPDGAASDLTNIIQDYSQAEDAIDERENDLAAELKLQYEKTLAKAHEKAQTNVPKPTPY